MFRKPADQEEKKRDRVQRWRSVLLMSLAGAAYGFSFPRWNLWFLLPPALWLLLDHLLRYPEKKAAFRNAFVFAFAAHAVLLPWVFHVLTTYGDTGWVWGMLALLLLLLYLGLIWGLWGWFASRLATRYPLALFLGLPALWVLRDLLQEFLLTGFPWCRAGIWTLHLPLWPQWASLGGVHLLSYTLVLSLLLLPRPQRSWRHPCSAALLVILGFLALGGAFLKQWNRHLEAGAPHARIGVLQPNATLENPLYGPQELQNLLNDSSRLARQGAQLVVWPEYSVERVYPFQNPDHFDMLATFSRQQAALMACFNHHKGSDGVFNSVLLLHRGVTETYAKHHLVPFGEYIPYRTLFSFIDRISSGVSDYTPGQGPHILRSGPWPVATPVCFEILFPDLVRRMVAQGGTLLLNPSNDAWYGSSSAPTQLLMMSRLRALENRRWLIRATTNGLTALINPHGGVQEVLPRNRKAMAVWNLRLRQDLTPFTRWGNLLPWLFLLLALGGLLSPASRPPGPTSTHHTPAPPQDAGLIGRLFSARGSQRRNT